MLKVIVIGSPGAGKSTFSRKLRERTNLPLFYLDMIWHKLRFIRSTFCVRRHMQLVFLPRKRPDQSPGFMSVMMKARNACGASLIGQ